jgi:cell wall-associated NlpC family hydrolase
MTYPESDSRRFPPVVTAAVMIVTLAFAGPPAAWAAGADSSATPAAGISTGSEASLQTQAQELAGQIQANGVQLDQLDEAYNAAELQFRQLASQEASLKKSIARTDLLVAVTKRALKEQAVLAYITGGAPLITHVPDSSGTEPNLATSYAEIISGGQQRAIANYHSVVALQTAQSQSLESAEQQATLAVASIQSDQAAAARTLANQTATLAEVKGRLAVAVAQVESSQQQAEQAAVETSLSQQGQLPPNSSPVASNPSSRSTTTTQPQPTGPPTTTPPRTPPTTTPPRTPPTTVPPAPPNNPAPGYQVAISYAQAQLGKPYQWGGSGPNSFDCSGLVMMAWAQAGVYFPHLAQDQYDMTERIPLSDLLPGDLVFYGTPDDVYHVGLYIGGGDMIDAPETGQNVQIQSIYWSGLLGAGRVQS